MFNFEKVDSVPVFSRSGKYSPITEQIVNAEPNEWIKITGFLTPHQLTSVYNNLYSGKRCISRTLRENGYKLEHKSDKKNLTMYVRKVSLESNKKEGLNG